jgi:signal transduction histidine kinase
MFLFVVNGHVAGQSAKTNQTNLFSSSFETLDSLAVANRIANINLAHSYARQAYQVSIRSGIIKDVIRANYLLAITSNPEDKDSSFFKLNQAVALSKQFNQEGELSNILFSLALLYKDAGDVKTSLTYLDSALAISQRYDQFSNIARIYNTLGNIYLEGNDSVAAHKMYLNAFRLGEQHHDFTIQGIAAGNLAQFSKNTSDLIKELNKAILLLKKSNGHEEEIAQFLVNAGLATTSPVQALKIFAEALTIGKQGNLSISQLGVFNNIVYSLLDTGNPDSATSCVVNYAIPLAKNINSHDWLATLYDTYSDILIYQGKFPEATLQLKKAIAEKAIDDQQKATVQVRLLAAMMDTKNKEADLEKSTKDLKFNQMVVKVQYLAGLALALIASFVIMMLILRNQRKKIILKTREIALTKRIVEFEENQTAILGRELHDVVSSLMQRLAGHVKSLDLTDQEAANLSQNRLDELLAGIRTISHRMNKLDFKTTTLTELLSELSFDMVTLTGINLTMDLPEKLPALSEALSRNVYRIIQEMLTNAGKYAGGASVKLSVGAVNDRLLIVYQDHGPGMDPLTSTTVGIGLSGIRDRVAAFGGSAQLETSPGKGLSWLISLPLMAQID